METPSKIPVVPYDELVFMPLKKLDVWRGPWHKEGSWGVLATLNCGHKKSFSKSKIPQHHTICVQCTLNRRRIPNVHNRQLEVA